MSKKMRTERGFDPLKKFVVMETYEGYPKYVPKTVKGMPLYNADKDMIMVPATKLPADAMIEWLKWEYPDSQTEFIRHTNQPFEKMDGSIFYPPEVFECKVWLYGRRNSEQPDANGWAKRDNDIRDPEYDPLGSARTSSLMSALRVLGFGVDITPEETYPSLGPDINLEEKCPSAAFQSKKMAEIQPGYFVEVGQADEHHSEAFDAAVINGIIKNSKAALEESKKKVLEANVLKDEREGSGPINNEQTGEGVENDTATVSAAPEAPHEQAPVQLSVEEPTLTEQSEEKPLKKKRGRPRKDAAESPKKVPETQKEHENEEYIPAVFRKSPELENIANMAFVTEEGASEAMKKLHGKSFVEIYKDYYGLLRAITKVQFQSQGKVPHEVMEAARAIMEAEEE